MPIDDRIRRDLRDGFLQGILIAVIALVIGQPILHKLYSAPHAAAPVAVTAQVPKKTPSLVRQLDFKGVSAPRDVHKVAQWVVEAADNGSLPFAIVDKRRARLYVFEAGGALRGTTPVLLGYAAGDESVPGIGQRPIDQVRPQERTTPAGRFVAIPGRDARGETVIWVDYDLGVSMHRVLTTNPKERRLERLASPVASARRISWGCINLPVGFFEGTVWPLFSSAGAVVYVLPEQEPLEKFFPRVDVPAQL